MVSDSELRKPRVNPLSATTVSMFLNELSYAI